MMFGMTDIMPYEAPEAPRLYDDIKNAALLTPSPLIDRIEKGVRLHPNGMVEEYEAVIFQ